MSIPTRTSSMAPAGWEAARGQLVAFVARRVENLDVAEDITQGVLERLARTGTDAVDNPQAWLHRAARNAIIDHYRTRRAEQPLDAEIAAGPTPEDVLDQPERELAQCLRPLIDQLPDHYARALVLVDLDGATNAAAAAIENVSVSGMKSRVQRGRRQLAALLTSCCQITLNTDNSVDHYVAPRDCACSSTG